MTPSTRLKPGEYFGRAMAAHRTAGLIVVESAFSAGLRIPRHEHEHAYLSLIRSGSFIETFGRRSRACSPGMLLVNPPGAAHAERMDGEPVSSLNIDLSAEWLRELFDFGVPLDRPAEVRDQQIASLGLRLWQEVNCQDKDSALTIETLTWEILHASLRRNATAPDRRPRWLRDVRDLVDYSLGDPPSLQKVAKEVGVHPVHFAAVFRRFHGCSLGEYYRRRRLEAARTRLAERGMSLARVALDLGFSDQSHFTRTFKRFTGMTPGQYRTFLGFKTS